MPDRFQSIDFPVRSKHRTQFESQDVWIASNSITINLRYFPGRLTVQAGCLEQDRHAVEANDAIDLTAIERDNIVARLILDVSASHKWNAGSESLPRPVQHILFFRIAKVVHVAGVHVDGVHESGLVGRDQLPRKRVD